MGNLSTNWAYIYVLETFILKCETSVSFLVERCSLCISIPKARRISGIKAKSVGSSRGKKKKIKLLAKINISPGVSERIFILGNNYLEVYLVERKKQ